ncbi:hypothetical protein [Mycoplasma mycoides]|uniref:hypothetical protein n=1 Tax=Mycoplasma mycoides TaxID=2102 RepID=UPI0027340894|nr:hypothetical protein [Mycoplasma mycoides]MDP4040679.1 hypothetical protein [Mycoplasma mycoides]MDP4041502.1 hypothetical protein [Mycoplasma mycoides]MDP4042440.1 hypothetical protein [Mycoplasma mycoides]MDP4043850.1 hypothetical protein [Mycoplasma mycoides]MDP4044787.1 hypothetical protein [Mycoplasma mycoides]
MKKLFNILGLNFLLISTIISSAYLKNNDSNNTNLVLKSQTSVELEKLKKEVMEYKELLDQEFSSNKKLLEENRELKAKLKDYLKIKTELLEFKEFLNNEYNSNNELLKEKEKLKIKLKEYEQLFKVLNSDEKYFKNNDPSQIINLINESKNKLDSNQLDKTQQIAISIGAGLTLLSISICGAVIGLNKRIFKKSKKISKIIITR